MPSVVVVIHRLHHQILLLFAQLFSMKKREKQKLATLNRIKNFYGHFAITLSFLLATCPAHGRDGPTLTALYYFKGDACLLGHSPSAAPEADLAPLLSTALIGAFNALECCCSTNDHL